MVPTKVISSVYIPIQEHFEYIKYTDYCEQKHISLFAWSRWSNNWFNILCSYKRDWILNA